MQYAIIFKDAKEVELVLGALGKLPHDQVRNTMDSIMNQVLSLEKEAAEKSRKAIIEEEKSKERVQEVTQEQESSTEEETEETTADS